MDGLDGDDGEDGGELGVGLGVEGVDEEEGPPAQSDTGEDWPQSRL